jgi:hypothetical protein
MNVIIDLDYQTIGGFNIPQHVTFGIPGCLFHLDGVFFLFCFERDKRATTNKMNPYSLMTAART